MSDTAGKLIGFSFIIAMIAAWFTHVIHCLFAAKYMLLLAGGFIAPIGVLHGVGLWFGVSW